jgi:drug/metabolite transporter (DMT)-like permease
VQPVLTAFLAAIFLQERITVVAIIAAAMIFGGVALAGWRRRPALRPSDARKTNSRPSY